jgi:large conductance mechanosensitive channel
VKDALKDFKAFILRGNVVDLAVGVAIGFVLIAAALFFLVVRPINHMMARRKTEPEVMSTTRDCPYCLSSIPIAASRCAFCTADVGAAS